MCIERKNSPQNRFACIKFPQMECKSLQEDWFWSGCGQSVWYLHGKEAFGGCCWADWRCGGRAWWPPRRQRHTASATAPAHRIRKLLTITTTKTREFMPNTVPSSFAATKCTWKNRMQSLNQASLIDSRLTDGFVPWMSFYTAIPWTKISPRFKNLLNNRNNSLKRNHATVAPQPLYTRVATEYNFKEIVRTRKENPRPCRELKPALSARSLESKLNRKETRLMIWMNEGCTYVCRLHCSARLSRPHSDSPRHTRGPCVCRTRGHTWSPRTRALKEQDMPSLVSLLESGRQTMELRCHSKTNLNKWKNSPAGKNITRSGNNPRQ